MATFIILRVELNEKKNLDEIKIVILKLQRKGNLYLDF